MRRMASNDFPLVTTFVNFGPGHTHATIEAQAELSITNDQSKFTKMFDLRDGKNGRSICCPQRAKQVKAETRH